ncbi:Vitamin B12 import ATP-binding protein BtuD [subsurface metagenome]
MDDVRISGPDPSRIPIFQEDSLWPWLRVTENVTLFTRLSRGVSAANSQTEKAHDLLERVGLQPDIDRKYPKELSVGMRKRVEVARALFATPKVVLADEPFGSLDPETRTKLHQLVQTIWEDQGLTIIFSTHDIAEAIYLASEIVVLQMPNGKVGGIFTNPLQGKSEAQRKHPQSYYLLHNRLRCAMRARGS